ncbi:MAG: 50S ribosomal protein L21 [Proteobacteria bacterium]|nr:50S ribosomal protein L21 [Pseudomonadota bacterium]
MFAIIRTGGKQYKVQPDQVVTVERLEGEAGDILSLETILMIGDGSTSQVGHPFLTNSVVKAQLLEQIRADKIIVFKKRRRHNYRRKQGHRQNLSVLRIVEISGPNGLKAVGKTPSSSKGASPKSEKVTIKETASSPKASPAKTAAKTSENSPKKEKSEKVASTPKKAPKKA